MRLIDVCEPLFEYICTLNRSARKGGGIYDQAQVKADVKQILADMKYTASQDNALATRYDEIEIVLQFFVDSMIRRSALPFAQDWSDLAYEQKELAGEDRFFELLDKTLADRSTAATDKLAVFYTCLGLGFTGFYAGEVDVLRKKMLEISARVRPIFEASQQPYICPEAYSFTNTSNLIQPPAASLVGIGIGLAGLIGVLLVTYIYLYYDSTSQLKNSLRSITQSRTSQVQSPTPGR